MSYTLASGRIDLDQDVVCTGSSSSKGDTKENKDSDDSFICVICASDLSTIDAEARQEHYDLHFAEESMSENRELEITEIPPPNSGNKGTSSPSKTQSKLSWKLTKVIERSDVFWYSSLPTKPPKNFTPGLIPFLKKALWSSHAQGTTRKAALCYPGTVHISQDLWDKFWGCGYRNYLMSCTALMNQTTQPDYFPLLDVSPTPGVRNLQRLIEDAWAAGFDKVGAQQLKHLKNTRKWIGTGDVWVAFSYRGIPAELVDFNLKDQARGVNVILDWVVNYFTPKSNNAPASINQALMGASPITVTDRMPLILQHNGHSRLIVGYEINKTGHIDLLTFDPAHRIPDDTRRAALAIHQSNLNPPEKGISGSPGNSKKRLLDEEDSLSKRARSSGPSQAEDDDEIVFLKTVSPAPKQPQSRRENEKNEKISDDPGKILARFRIKTKKLSKKEYQILYFPMTAPLTEKERMQRKEVVSTRVC